MSDKTYASTIANSYVSNISGLLLKIKDAHSVINAKARELGLYIPANSKLTAAASSNSPVELLVSHKLLDTVAAIDSILLAPGLDGSKNLKAGYYPTTPLTNYLSGDATAGDIVLGKKAWTAEGEIEGSLPVISNPSQSKTYGSENIGGTTVLTVKIPNTGKYEDTVYIPTDIAYHASGVIDASSNATWNPEIQIDKVNTPGGGEETVVNSLVIPAGYYTNTITVKPVLNFGESNKVLNYRSIILGNDFVLPTAVEGYYNITPGEGYDYISDIKIAAGTNSSVSINPIGVNGTVSLTTTDVTKGWITNNPTLGSLQLTLATAKNNNKTTYIELKSGADDPEFIITPGNEVYIPKLTWTGKGIIVKSAAEGNNANITLNGPELESGSYKIGYTNTAGYVPAHSTRVDLTTMNRLQLGALNGTATESIKLTTKTANIKANSYTKGGTTISVQEAVTTILVSGNVVQVLTNFTGGKDGWFEGVLRTVDADTQVCDYNDIKGINKATFVAKTHKHTPTSGKILTEVAIDLSDLITELESI